MSTDILLRLGIASLLALALVGAYQGFNRLFLFRKRHRLEASGLAFTKGVPALLYFSSPDCVPCRTIQRPVVERLAQSFGQKLQIIEIDTLQSPDITRSWGILSLPTTIVVDTKGQPHTVNHGIVSLEALERQVQAVLV